MFQLTICGKNLQCRTWVKPVAGSKLDSGIYWEASKVSAFANQLDKWYDVPQSPALLAGSSKILTRRQDLEVPLPKAVE